MPQVSESVTIGRPVTTVFQIASDTNRVKEWQPDVTEAVYTDNRIRVGVMVTQSRNTHMLGWRLDLNADITDYTPNRLIEYKGVLGRFPVTGQLEFESGGGQTTVTETLDIRMPFLFFVFGPFMRSTMRSRTRRSLEALKSIAEGER